MTVFLDWFLIIRGRLTRFQRCVTILIVMIRIFYMGTIRWNARLFVLMPFPTTKSRFPIIAIIVIISKYYMYSSINLDK